MEDSYEVSKNTAALIAVVIVILVVLAGVGAARHLRYMEVHCDAAGGAGPGPAAGGSRPPA